MLNLVGRIGALRYLALLVPIGMIVAGFLVSPEARTDDDALQLNHFLWGLGAFFLLTDLGMLVFFRRRRLGSLSPGADWVDAHGEILDLSRHPFPIHGRSVVAMTLLVHSTHGPPDQVHHRQTFTEEQMERLSVGHTVNLKVNPRRRRELVVTV